MLQLPRVGWRLLACENGASPDCIIVVVAVPLGVVLVVYAECARTTPTPFSRDANHGGSKLLTQGTQFSR